MIMDELINIVDIDFKNKDHKTLIKVLSKKNDYYVGDILVSLKDMEFLKLQANNYCIPLEKTLIGMGRDNAFYEDDDRYGGWLIYYGTKVIGFLMYYNGECKDVLHFFLIDKPYQNMGYGSLLLKFFMVSSKNPIIKIAESDITGYYEKFGFMNLKRFEKRYPNILILETPEQKNKKALYYNNIK